MPQFLPGSPISKRCLDLFGSSLGLLLISPILLIVAILAWIYHGRPILFRQVRPGYHGQPFNIYKFRTMLDLRDGEGECSQMSNALLL
jgi:lipopolysaccharide/colanic/teichoic acid biosynthesis glycosyltransferase